MDSRNVGFEALHQCVVDRVRGRVSTYQCFSRMPPFILGERAQYFGAGSRKCGFGARLLRDDQLLEETIAVELVHKLANFRRMRELYTIHGIGHSNSFIVAEIQQDLLWVGMRGSHR